MTGASWVSRFTASETQYGHTDQPSRQALPELRIGCHLTMSDEAAISWRPSDRHLKVTFQLDNTLRLEPALLTELHSNRL